MLVRLASNGLPGPAQQAGDALYDTVAGALRRSHRAACLAEFHEDPQSGHLALLGALTAEMTRDRVFRSAVSRQVYAVHNARTCRVDTLGQLAS